jgi:hypothetical protein
MTAATTTTTSRRGSVALRSIATSLIATSLLSVAAVRVADAGASVKLDGALTRPHVLHNHLADVIVRIRGGAVCSGTPITGTKFVVTAAHCVLDAHSGIAASRTVIRNGVEYKPVAVLIDPHYHLSSGPRLDAAVLVMDRIIPGPSATIGTTFPTTGLVTLAGFQPLDTDGSLLRGTRYNNTPLPKGTTGGVITINTAAAGCVRLVSDAQVTATQVKLPCGLIPGASGGGLFTDNNGTPTLIGITSTVAPDLSYNGLVPLTALHNLLAHPTQYFHTLTAQDSTPAVSTAVRS